MNAELKQKLSMILLPLLILLQQPAYAYFGVVADPGWGYPAMMPPPFFAPPVPYVYPPYACLSPYDPACYSPVPGPDYVALSLLTGFALGALTWGGGWYGNYWGNNWNNGYWNNSNWHGNNWNNSNWHGNNWNNANWHGNTAVQNTRANQFQQAHNLATPSQRASTRNAVNAHVQNQHAVNSPHHYSGQYRYHGNRAQFQGGRGGMRRGGFRR